MGDWLRSTDGTETICENKDAVIRRLMAALAQIADSDAYHDGAAKFMQIAREALDGKRISDLEIRDSVKAGVLQYWSDCKAQSDTYDAWMRGGMKGPCPGLSHGKGDIIDYVTRSVVAAVHTA